VRGYATLCVALVYHVFWGFSMMFVLLLIFAKKEKKPIIKLSYFLSKNILNFI
jgi:hypothetical protein